MEQQQKTEPGGQGRRPVGSILEAARAVLTVTRTAQSRAANEEDPDIGYNRVRERAFVPYTQL